MRLVYPAALAALMLAACGPAATPSPVAVPSAPAKDMTTPDRALRSYWAAQDAFDALEEAAIKARRAKAAGLLPQYLTGEAAAHFRKFDTAPRETMQRDIVEVKTETASRATIVATIKNTTPIPAGSAPAQYLLDAKEKGDRYRYIMETEGGEWRVAQIWAWRDYLSPPKWDKYTVPELQASTLTTP